jgi:ligand-binding sensor domain-containing protein
MRRQQLSLAVLIASLFLPATASAAAPEWQSIANGDDVLALAFAPGEPNVLWSGTEGGGLVRWNLADGSFSQSLFPNQPGLAGNNVRDIAFAPDGSAWLAVPGGGVTRVAGDEWRAFGAAEGLPDNLEATAIAVTGDGTVWLGTRSGGLYRLPAGAASWSAVRFDEANPAAGPGSDSVADLAVSPDGKALWVAHGRTHDGDPPAFSVLDAPDSDWRTIRALAPGTAAEAESASPPTGQIMALTFDAAGTLWAAAWAKGVLAYDGKSWRQFSEADGVCGKNVWAVAAGGQDVWVACGQSRTGGADRGAGAARWDGSAWKSVTAADGLPSEDVVALAVGSERAYLGTNSADQPGNGVIPIGADQRPASALVTAGQAPASNDITSVAFTPDGSAWVGTRGAGLLHRSAGQWYRLTTANTPGLAGDMVTALTTDGQRLYVGALKSRIQDNHYVDGGLSILDLDSGKWRMIRSADGGLPDDEVSSLAVAPDGRLWVGLGAAQGGPGTGTNTQSGDGLAVYDPANDSWGSVTRASTGGGLAGDTVAGVVAAGQDLWVAASYALNRSDERRGGGVSRLASDVWQGWSAGGDGFKTYGEGEAGVTGDVRAVLEDTSGTAWAGTWHLANTSELNGRWPRVDAVVNRWDGQAWQSDTFDSAGWVSTLAEEAGQPGRVWAGTTRGHVTEFSPSGSVWLDAEPGGVWVRDGDEWVNWNNHNSGLSANGITAMAVEPATGDLWLGTESSGLSIARGEHPVPAPTACAACPAPLAGLTLVAATASAPPTWIAPALVAAALAAVGLVGLAWWRRSRSRSAT